MKGKFNRFTAMVLLAALLATFLFAWGNPDLSRAADTVQGALEYLRKRQRTDGGFAEPGRDSSDHLTGWAVCAIAAGGEDPGSWRVAEKSPLDYLSANAGKWTALSDLERNCLAVCSAGADPRSFGGRNLVAEISGQIKADGHLGDMINDHCWGLIALAAAGETVPDGCRSWLVARQNIDGGFSFSEESASDPDDTGTAMQALAAAGESPDGSALKRATSYLRFCQSSDGGFRWQTATSNTGSTAWAVQGLAAAGEDPDSSSWSKSGSTPIDFLKSMQQADGHIKYSGASDANPAWMTAEAVPALLKKPYPLGSTPEADSGVVSSDSSEDSLTTSTVSDPVESSRASLSDNELFVFTDEAALEEVVPEGAVDELTGTGSYPGSGGSESSANPDNVSPDDGGNLFAMGPKDPGYGNGGGSSAGNVPLFFIVCGALMFVLGLITLGMKSLRQQPRR